MVIAPVIKLNSGYEMPLLGLGTYKSMSGECEQSVKYAIDVGYRHIDSAFVYQNESEVGRAVNAKIAEGVKREELFIVTKLAGMHHDPHIVERACRESLKNLGLDYIDLYLIHTPIGNVYVDDSTKTSLDKPGQLIFSDVDYVDTWKALEKLVKMKLVRSIGLSNFNKEQTERVLKECEIKPVTNQVECHPGFNQKKLIQFSKEHDIIITAYCPLARPNPANKTPKFLFNDEIAALSKKYNKTPAQIALRYLIQLGAVPIPKSVSKNRIEENINVFDFKLNDEDMKIMDSFDTGKRTIPFLMMREHKYYPFNAEF